VVGVVDVKLVGRNANTSEAWTSDAVGPGTDFWILAVLVSGIGSMGTAFNIIATVLCMRCPGMTLGKMPLFAWLNLTMAGLVILSMSPLTAAQLMLLVDRYPRPSIGSSAVATSWWLTSTTS